MSEDEDFNSEIGSSVEEDSGEKYKSKHPPVNPLKAGRGDKKASKKTKSSEGHAHGSAGHGSPSSSSHARHGRHSAGKKFPVYLHDDMLHHPAPYTTKLTPDGKYPRGPLDNALFLESFANAYLVDSQLHLDEFEALDGDIAWNLGRPIPTSKEIRERQLAASLEPKRDVRFMGQMYSPMTDDGRMFYKAKGVKVPFKL